MNVCFGYEKMSDKAKLAKLDELIASYQNMANAPRATSPSSARTTNACERCSFRSV